MKRFLFGVIISFLGIVFFAFCFAYAIINPGVYDNIEGLIGSLLVNDLMIPFIISFIILVVGLLICGYEAYFNK
ncbi:hypothetical protein K0040_18500 [Terrisporobacter petrolearius]|uniref:hypothetical protein n=1 Tax=Terrisporobacter petrolearius TaxID=1460447 RepID=UPI001D15F1E6|nr:hypothetical protein [Terrisporobacter petrolearius]MCC3866242.1 hypothetical protein [Terrisporobacter petrolearius]